MLRSFREFAGDFREIAVTQGTGESAITIRVAFTESAAAAAAAPAKGKKPAKLPRMTAIDSLTKTPPDFGEWGN